MIGSLAGFRETLRADIDVGRFQRPESRSRSMNLILVSHGLTLRVFLMRWYKWTVQQFESLYNFGNSEMLVMELGPGGRYSHSHFASYHNVFFFLGIHRKFMCLCSYSRYMLTSAEFNLPKIYWTDGRTRLVAGIVWLCIIRQMSSELLAWQMTWLRTKNGRHFPIPLSSCALPCLTANAVKHGSLPLITVLTVAELPSFKTHAISTEIYLWSVNLRESSDLPMHFVQSQKSLYFFFKNSPLFPQKSSLVIYEVAIDKHI